jgi:hypothetical protein
MRNFKRFWFCSLIACVLAPAASAHVPALPSCDVCIGSCDYGYHIDDRTASYTHWTMEEGEQTLCGSIKQPSLKFSQTPTSHVRPIRAHDCQPTLVTRSFETPSHEFIPTGAHVEVAFASEHCHVDCCGCVHCQTCIGPEMLVFQDDFHVHDVVRQAQHSAKTVECRPIVKQATFRRVTTDCEIGEADLQLSKKGCKLTFTGQTVTARTGRARLTKTPAVHVVHVPCSTLPPPPLHCVSCTYTPLHEDEAAESLPTPRTNRVIVVPRKSIRHTPAWGGHESSETAEVAGETDSATTKPAPVEGRTENALPADQPAQPPAEGEQPTEPVDAAAYDATAPADVDTPSTPPDQGTQPPTPPAPPEEPTAPTEPPADALEGETPAAEAPTEDAATEGAGETPAESDEGQPATEGTSDFETETESAAPTDAPGDEAPSIPPEADAGAPQ